MNKRRRYPSHCCQSCGGSEFVKAVDNRGQVYDGCPRCYIMLEPSEAMSPKPLPDALQRVCGEIRAHLSRHPQDRDGTVYPLDRSRISVQLVEAKLELWASTLEAHARQVAPLLEAAKALRMAYEDNSVGVRAYVEANTRLGEAALAAFPAKGGDKL